MLFPQRLRDAVLLHDFTVKTVRLEDRPEGANPAYNRRGGRGRTRFKRLQCLRCGAGQDNVPGPEAHYSLGPLWIASRSCGEASGTQIDRKSTRLNSSHSSPSRM